MISFNWFYVYALRVALTVARLYQRVLTFQTAASITTMRRQVVSRPTTIPATHQTQIVFTSSEIQRTNQ